MSHASTTTMSLEDSQVLRYQRREWIAEWIGWLLLIGILLAALLGLLGPGPLSDVQIMTTDGRLEVKYDRFVHAESPGELRVRIQLATGGSKVVVQLDRSFTELAVLEDVSPQPERVELAHGGLKYHFAVSPQTPEASIVFRYRFNSFGRLKHTVSLSNETAVEVGQLIFP